ncbi:MAG: NAD-dependent epimerase/dehydratase family protein [Nitrososphaerota archaeon]
MRVLVTGASGFLGGHLVEELVELGYKVRAFVRKTSDTRLLRQLEVEIVTGDITDPSTLPPAMRGVDCVVHLAAYYTFFGRKELYELVNVKGTEWTARAALESGVRRFIYCSSTEAIGPIKNPPGDENSELNPQFEYGKSKARAEKVVKSLSAEGLEYTIIRPTGIYGPRNVDDVAYWFLTSYAKGGLASRIAVGSGQNLVQFTHVKDVVQGFILAMEKEVAVNQVYIIGEDRWYTYNQVYQILHELCGKGPPSFRLPPALAKLLLLPLELYDTLSGEGNIMHRRALVDAVTSDRAYSVEKAKRELGFKPRYDLRSGLRETLDWYRLHGYLD